jgi:hypothetical protein
MIRLPLLLTTRRFLWLPPLVIFLIVLAAVYATPGPALAGYSVTAIAFVGLGVWLTVITGSCDDDAHRELLAARLGSLRRAHAGRALASLVILIILSVWSTIMPVAAGTMGFQLKTNPPVPSPTVILLAGLAVHISFGMLGVAFGTFLHRPIVTRTAVSVLIGIGVTALIPVTSPLIGVLRDLNHEQVDTTAVLLVASAIICALAIAASSFLASRK